MPKAALLIALLVGSAACPSCTQPADVSGRAAVGLVPSDFARHEVTSVAQAEAYAEAYARSLGLRGVRPYEVAELRDRYFVYLEESDTRRGAFAMDIGRDGSLAPMRFPAMDPDMMWNQKYGHQARAISSIEMELSPEEARSRAQSMVGRGVAVQTPKAFYGYYLFPLTRQGHVVGQAAVNARNGEVVWRRWPPGFRDLLAVPRAGAAR